jgi:SpoVK/Ycf46/Vps4 family AAA+-type ATPase
MDDWGFERKLSHGKGTSALFAGPPGTGKTMAAEVIAHELGVDLFKIDLSTVVSKYIGETEKNLEQIFAAATDADAILFFDEADALFGKRSEVRDAHDRYANVEVAYLLQRMEDYDGLAILATNLRQHLDDAFIRRLQFVVEFPFPDDEERGRIWAVSFPVETPRDPGIDYAALGRRFRLAGGNIKNIVLAAAFAAAADGAAVGSDHLLRAARREYQKMGKVLPDADFTLPSGAG